MKSLAVLILVAAFPITALADEPKLLRADNGLNGHVYLTQEKCELTSPVPIAEEMKLAYSLMDEGTTNVRRADGCWFSPAIDYSVIPEELRAKTVKLAIILGPDGAFYRRLLQEFEEVDSVKGAF
jgi:hypothetical protein